MQNIAIIEDTKPLFQNALVIKEIKWEAESQFALQSLQKNDYLAKIASSNQASLQNAIINIAAIGVSLNPALKHAYLVPRDNMVCLDISYMGLLHLAMESGAIVFGQARLVYSNDNYQNTGIDTAPIHQSNTFGDRGEIVGVYCTVKIPSGEYLTEEMNKEELDKIKATSKAKKGSWQSWESEMMRKSVVKRASKYWGHSKRMGAAIDNLNSFEGNEAPPEKVIEGEIVEYYPEDDFATNFPVWENLVTSGQRTAEDILAILSSKANFNEVQQAAILAIGESDAK